MTSYLFFRKRWLAAVVFLGLATTTVPAQSIIRFVRSDCNVDGSVDLSDAVYLLVYNFAGRGDPTCFDACDANDDGVVTGQVTDALYLLAFLFRSGSVPPDPGPSDCGADPTDDGLDCQSFGACTNLDPDCPTFRVSLTAGQRNPDIDVNPDGTFIVVWEDDRDGNGLFQIRARGYFPDLTELIDTFTVNSSGSGQQINPAIALHTDGSFVVVWEDDGNDNGLFEIRVRGFNADGTERFPQFDVNVNSGGQQINPEIAMDAAGNFVIVWQDDRNEDGLFNIHGRGFHPDGTERIAQFTVNSRDAGQQSRPDIAMQPDGKFVVVWENDGANDGFFEVRARAFNADGTERLEMFTVNDRRSGQQLNPAIDMNASGVFAVVWEDDRDGDGQFQVHARVFNADGTERLEQFTVNIHSAGQQINPVVSMDEDGNMVFAFESDRDGDGEAHVRMVPYGPDGVPPLESIKVDCQSARHKLDNRLPTISLSESGRVLAFWNEIDKFAAFRTLGRVIEDAFAPPAK